MIYILEGIDGSGKTTLANALSEMTGLPIIHKSYPKTEEEKASMVNDYKVLFESGTSFIMDRAFYSEMVYGPVMRGKSIVSESDMLMLEEIIKQHGGGMIIYCTGCTFDMWMRCQSRGEDYVQRYLDYLPIHNLYDKVIYEKQHLLPILTYDSFKVPIE